MIAANRHPAEQWIISEIEREAEIFRCDLLSVNQIIARAETCAPRAIKNTFTEQRVSSALKVVGAVPLGQVRFGPERGRVRLWALRRKEMYTGVTDTKLRELYLRQEAKELDTPSESARADR
jgi:hypothetical protein